MREFNITGCCFPDRHYMVDLTERLEMIKTYIDKGNYFSINRGRQYGKTTMLKALAKYLKQEYIVIGMDFQKNMTELEYTHQYMFVEAFADEFIRNLKRNADNSQFDAQIKMIRERMNTYKENYGLVKLFQDLSDFCFAANKPVVLIIDEVDSAANNQLFLDFLSQLRGYYLDRDETSTFQSVILAGVHDIRNLKQKIRSDSEHKHNSPWNIASSFDVDMNFSVSDIEGMLSEYKNEHKNEMDLNHIAQKIYDYTYGYPVLVSTLCKYMDEQFSWSEEGFAQAIHQLVTESIPLFESLINKLEDNEELRNLISKILFNGEKYHFNEYDTVIRTASMYGFIKNTSDTSIIANRIFEIVLYDWFMSVEKTKYEIYSIGEYNKNQFIQNGKLDMELLLEKFVLHFNDIYGSQPDKFKEEDGRMLFLLYLRPIINGSGNYYIEAQTRDQRRTDVIIDYLGNQYIIELKIWRGEEYNNRGEQQLADYLEYYHADKGYMLSFNFNINKQIGVNTIKIGNKTIIEAVV